MTDRKNDGEHVDTVITVIAILCIAGAVCLLLYGAPVSAALILVIIGTALLMITGKVF